MAVDCDTDDFKDTYHKGTVKKILFVVLFVSLAVGLFWISLCIGTRELSVERVYSLLISHLSGETFTPGTLDWNDDRVVWDYRVPRAIFAIVAGASLSVAGAVMQSVMKNPLADAYTTGVSSGALFGVAIAIVLGFSVGSGGIDGIGITINAIIFSLLPIVVIVVMAPMFNKSPSTLILGGIAVSYLFNAFTSVLLVSTSAENLSWIYSWQVGSFSGIKWDAIPSALLSLIVGMLILWPISNKLNLMSLADKDAKALGLDSEKYRVICLVLIALMVSTVISFAGIIGFVGLVIPHIVRMVVGADNKFVIPGSMAFGAFFLLACDIISRIIDVSAAVPVGVVTSFIGAPIFMLMIIRQKKGVW